ncbi:MAG: protein kinase, partial [Myxococcota bacterium]
MSQVASALALAHEQNIVHRDLKPSNVMLISDMSDAGEQGERVKVCDFGLAKILDVKPEDDSQGPLTKAGVIFGTPAYMAPEQAQGDPIDHRADIYALGVMLFRMVTGRPLFRADSATGILMKQIMDEPPKTQSVAPECDERLAALIDACLQKDPAARPSSMRDILPVLREVASTSLPTSPGLMVPSSLPEPVPPSSSAEWVVGQKSGPTRADATHSAPVSQGGSHGAHEAHEAVTQAATTAHDPSSPSFAEPPLTYEQPARLETLPPSASPQNYAGFIFGSIALVIVGGVFSYVVLRGPASAPQTPTPAEQALIQTTPASPPDAGVAKKAPSAAAKAPDESVRDEVA